MPRKRLTVLVSFALALAVSGAGSSNAWGMGKKKSQPSPPPVLIPPHDPSPSGHQFDLHVLTYNVHGLPFASKKRLKAIGQELAKRRDAGTAPHVVMLQETFTKRHKALVEAADYPYLKYGPKAKGLRLSSGLLILSEYPLVNNMQVIYKRCAGTDCFGRKGAMLTQVMIPGVPQPVELMDTHMQAGYSGHNWPDRKLAEELRLSQLGQVKGFMSQYRNFGLPAVFGGDFNFKSTGSDFALFDGFSRMWDSGKACYSVFGCEGDSNDMAGWSGFIDHLFYTADLLPSMAIEPIHYERSFEPDSRGKMLSDHYGVETVYRLNW